MRSARKSKEVLDNPDPWQRSGRTLIPKFDTGTAHSEPGVGRVGAGILHAPEGAFAAAFEASRKL